MCQSVQKVYCGKTADLIWMQFQFGVVSGVSRGMDELDGGGDRQRGRGSSGSKCGGSHCNQWGLAHFSAIRGYDASLPKLLWDFLLFVCYCYHADVKRLC